MRYASGGCIATLDTWLPLRGDEEAPLFVPINKTSKLTDRAMSDQTVLYIKETRARRG